MDDALIDAIYETAGVAEHWPDTLDRIGSMSDFVGGVLYVTNFVETRWTASSAIAPLFDQYLRAGWATRNPRPGRRAASTPPGFLTDQDLFTPDEIEKEPIYRDFFRGIGLGWGAGAQFRLPSDEVAIISFEKAFARGPIDAAAIATLDALRPHLGRAILLGWRQARQRSRSMLQALETIGMAAAILKSDGTVLATNDKFTALTPNVLAFSTKGLDVARGDNTALRQALDRARDRSDPRSARVAVRDAVNGNAHIAHVLPIVRDPVDIFTGATSLIVVTPVGHEQRELPAAILEALFDLSPTEARIARAVAAGRPMKAIARESKVSEHTVRSQLKAIFRKTGVRRQIELTKLLSSDMIPG